MQETPDYSTDNIKVVDIMTAIRLRPAMYIGNLNNRGLSTSYKQWLNRYRKL